jgi:hypothetical protein
MEKCWALDYVDEYECELVVDAQLYATEEARAHMDHPERYDITWYTKLDLEKDVFCCSVEITPELKVEVTEWWPLLYCQAGYCIQFITII